MISFLEGDLAEKAADRVVLSVGGVGYEVLVPVSTLARLPAVGTSARVYTRLQVREDALVLYGFSRTEERSLFDLLVTVSGVGPKLGLAFLSVFTPDALRRAVASSDVAALATVPGMLNGSWHHVAGVTSAAEGMKLYVDGTLVKSEPAQVRNILPGGPRRDVLAHRERRPLRGGAPARCAEGGGEVSV